MGASLNGSFERNNKIRGQSFNVMPFARNLGYTMSDVNKMFLHFKQMDAYDNGTASLKAFCIVNKIGTNLGLPMFKKLLQLEVDEQMTFKEYLLLAWNALSYYNNDNIAKLVFKIFNDDSTDTMTIKNVSYMIKTMYNEKYNETVIVSLRKSMTVDINEKEKTMSMENFIKYSEQSPNLLKPVYDLLRAVSRNTLGEQKWAQMARVRKGSDMKDYIENIIKDKDDFEKYNVYNTSNSADKIMQLKPQPSQSNLKIPTSAFQSRPDYIPNHIPMNPDPNRVNRLGGEEIPRRNSITRRLSITNKIAPLYVEEFHTEQDNPITLAGDNSVVNADTEVKRRRKSVFVPPSRDISRKSRRGSV